MTCSETHVTVQIEATVPRADSACFTWKHENKFVSQDSLIAHTVEGKAKQYHLSNGKIISVLDLDSTITTSKKVKIILGELFCKK